MAAYLVVPARLGSGPGSGLPYMNSQFGDTTYTKVFVGGLAWETQSETLRLFFEQFGEILEAVVISDKNTGRSKGYGFVTFMDPEAAWRACMDPTPIIDGRRANCNLASLGRARGLVPYDIQGQLRSPSLYVGSPPAAIGGAGYQQPVPYNYQQGYVYSLYGFSPYGAEYAHGQGIHFPHLSMPYPHLYGVPGMAASLAGQPQFVVPGHSPQFIQGSDSSQTAG